MKKRFEIRVKRNGVGTVEIIKRVPWFESIGNFNPMFCRYKGMRKQVQSEAGDLSDPFRREEDYLKSLYIVVE